MTKSGRGRATAQPKKKTQKQSKKQPKLKVANITNTLLNKAMSKGLGMAGLVATRAISKIVGMGDYTVKSNSIETAGGVIGGEVPHFGKENNSTRIRHREFISDIAVPTTPAAFNNTSYVINPANKTLFPWLASIAENWQQYRVHGMVLYYKTTTSDYSANGAMGKIAMATNYNVRDSAYANMVELENAEFSVSGKPSLSRMHPIECAPSNGLPLVRYVRDAQYDASGGDDRLYDVGKFQFATQGLPGNAGNVLGELWVSYDIEFYKPIVGRDPVAVQYEPVVVPQFNNLGGNSQTNNNYMFELSSWDFPSGASAAERWEWIHKPDKLARSSGPDGSPYVGGAMICRSLNRPVPDPDPSAYTYPAYWSSAVDTGINGTTLNDVTDKRELRLTRPGIWTFGLNAKVEVPANATGTTAQQTFSGQPGGVSQSSFTDFIQPAVMVEYRNSDNTRDTSAISTGAMNYNNSFYTFSANNRISSPIGRWYLQRSGAGWSMVLWVRQVDVSDGRYVALRFQTPNETQFTTGDPFKWDASYLFDASLCTGVRFCVGVSTVTEQTYYRPVTPGVTKDDEESLRDSFKKIMALAPKLRELGFVDPSFDS